MTNTPMTGPHEPNRGQPAAGWYPDGATPGVLRWWNGASWTEHTHDLGQTSAGGAPVVPDYAAASSPAAGHAAVSYPAAGYSTGYPSTAAAPALTPAASPYTPFAWIIALLPVLTIISFASWDLSPFVAAVVQQSSVRTGTGTAGMNPAIYADLGPGYAISVVIGWLVVAVTVVLAYLDYRRLGRAGFARRFYWAFSFLLGFGAIVYLIGRSVVVRSQVGRGMTVMWVYIALWVVSFIVVITKVVLAFAAAAPLMQR
ncbi:MAG: hypothetical protein JWQ64_165 [Subtercola sp.]|nr:hypothetical protein [Subtercola sp.]